MTTLAMPGQASVCFSCGQPLPKDIATSAFAAPPAPAAPGAAPPAPAAGPPAPAPAFPLTSALQAPELEPPPNPYGSAPTSVAEVGALP